MLSIALIVQLYLSINRVDLAKRECDRARKWAEDDLLLQHIEASIGLLTGKNAYSNPHTYYIEQLNNPSLTSGHLFLSRGVTHLLRGELPEAQSDLSEALKPQYGLTADALAGKLVATELTGPPSDVDTLWTYVSALCNGHYDSFLSSVVYAPSIRNILLSFLSPKRRLPLKKLSPISLCLLSLQHNSALSWILLFHSI